MRHLRIQVCALLCLALLGLLTVADSEPAVQLPTPGVPSDKAGRTLRLGPEDDFQQALDEAVSGDTIELQAGATYEGPFVLRHHAGSGWVTIISGVNAQDPLPPAGTRVTPANRGAMAALRADSGSVISTDPGAAWYHFVGVEIYAGNRSGALNLLTSAGRPMTNLVELGSGDNNVQEIPHHIILERSYLHGDPVLGTRRGVVLNGAHMTVVDSWLSDFKSTEDSQAIAGWEGTGPFLITNNYLEAAGENVMFGGADPSIEGRIPADITIAGNHFRKPLTWRQGHETHDGSRWSVKNLLELKNAKRVLIDGNLFEQNWPQAQNGFAILFTVRNQNGRAPWSLVENVTFSNNIVRKAGSGINILGYDDNHPSGRTRHIHIRNNLFYDIGGEWGEGRLLQFLGSPADIDLSHNTALQSDALLFIEGDPVPDVEMRGNIFALNGSGISGTGTRPGQPTIDAYLKPAFRSAGNLFIDAGDAGYPSDMVRVPDIDSVPFSDPASGDFRLRRLPDGLSETPGVDFSQLCFALSRSERPAFC